MKNMNELMKKAQELQRKMEEINKELEEARVTGVAGGGVVKAVVSGKLEIVSIDISAEVIEKDDKEMLEDMIVAAVKEAQGKAKKISQEKLAALGMPGGMPSFPN
jgi:DNA-binding YbaB/EbfC family protein